MRAFDIDPADPRTPAQRHDAGDWYIADDPTIQSDFRRALTLSGRFNAAYPQDPDAAQRLLLSLLGTMGEGAHV